MSAKYLSSASEAIALVFKGEMEGYTDTDLDDDDRFEDPLLR